MARTPRTPRMRFRFRKSFTLIPGLLRWTIARRSLSLNFNFGIFSRSWSTRGTTTTIDMPGTSGIFWRKEQRRRKSEKGAAEAVSPGAEERSLSRAVVLMALAVAAILACMRLGWALTVGDCAAVGSPWLIVAGLHGVLAMMVLGLWWRVPALRGAPFVLLAAVAAAGSWYGYGWLVADAIACH